MRPAPALLGLASAALILFAVSVALAHPLGMTSVNRYAGVRLDATEIEVDYLLDFAELPAYAEIESLDENHDSAVTPAERERYLDALVSRVAPTLTLLVNGTAAPLRPVFRSLEAPPGQNGLSTLRVAIEYRAPRPASDADLSLVLSDSTFGDRVGWRELGALESAFGDIVSSSVPVRAPRAGARLDYPSSELYRPPRENSLTLVMRPKSGAGPLGSSSAPGAPRGSPTSEGKRLAALVANPVTSPWFLLFALALSFALGSGHALTPGHGKALVGAYLVGTRSRPRDALVLGATVTISHTASVFALGFFALWIERRFGTARILQLLEIGSGLLVAAIAAWQLPGRLRRFLRSGAACDSARGDEHNHAHAGEPHHHGDGRMHTHGPPSHAGWRTMIPLGISGGLVPCPSALVVLLTAISLHRLAFGLALLVAFSLGLATVLTAIGIAFVVARERFVKLRTDSRIARALPVASSVLVLLLGLAIAAGGLPMR
ncbi:MAG: hypothetical protein HY898_08165 [Deltaproteobacteria bacterium]|nr:hypothetical protein [Deltaproteobacteria bacterium]